MKALPILFAFALPLAAAEKPNIVVILADDLGYGDVSCYNPERGKIPTPQIDELASQGMRFTDAHSSSGVCSPSRYTLLTGRYHWRSRLQAGIVGTWGASLIAADRMTLGTLARQQGYRTAAIGKWHLGWDWPIPEGKRELLERTVKKDVPASEAQKAMWKELFSQPIPGGPVDRGFDRYFGTDVPNWPPYCFFENQRTVGIPSGFLPAQLLKNNLASKQGPALKDWKLEEILPTLGERACTLIREHAATNAPFFLYLPLTAPHTPLAVNEAWKGKSGLGTYGDFVMETDALIGRVLETLNQSGAAKNTLVILTSDNGNASGPAKAAELEKQGHFPSGLLRGYKFDGWEGGHRVPFMVRWPGRVKAGSVCHQLVQQADLMATLADICGVKLPDNAGEDSFSLLPLLEGGDQPVRPYAVSCAASGVPAVREGSWKLILGPGGKWNQDEGHQIHLYNLDDDLGETRDLAKAHPKRVAEMRKLLDTLIDNGRSTPGPPQSNDVRVRRFPLGKAGSSKSAE